MPQLHEAAASLFHEAYQPSELMSRARLSAGGRPGRDLRRFKPKNSPETRCPGERGPYRGSFHQIVRHGIVWRQKEDLSFRGSRLR